MRHNKTVNHLGRKSGHRKAMLSNMACSLIMNKHIETTLAKAKSLRVYVEPLITKSKNDTTANRRVVFSYLKQKEAVTELSVQLLLRSLSVLVDTPVSSRPVSAPVMQQIWLTLSWLTLQLLL